MGPRYMRVYHVVRGRGSPVETRERWPNLGRAYHSIATQISIITRREKGKCGKDREPDRSCKGVQPKGGIPRKYPCEGTVSGFVDRHPHVEGAETGQQLEHLRYEQLEGVEHPVVAKVERETLDKCASGRGGICKGVQEPHGALGWEVADVAVQYAFGDRIEGFVDEEEGVEVSRPREKEKYVVDEPEREGRQGAVMHEHNEGAQWVYALPRGICMRPGAAVSYN